MRIPTPKSFHGKLLFLVALTTSTAVALVVGVAWSIDALRLRPKALSECSTSAAIVSLNSAAPLAFDDREAGQETLSALRSNPEVLYAILRDADGESFATFGGMLDWENLRADATVNDHIFRDNTLLVTKQVEHDGKRFGSLSVVYDLSGFQSRLRRQALITIGIGACAVFLALILALRLQRGLAHPITELIRASRKISETNDYSVRVRRFNDDELGRLADAFNAMIEQVAARDAELLEAQRAMAESNEQLQQFAYVASHDLQEPLRKIQTFSSMLVSDHGESLNDDGRMCVTRMDAAATRMRSLINDLLTYSRVTSKERQMTSVDLNVIVRDVINDLEVGINETSGRVEVGTLPIVQADAVHMRQLFQNLVSNALKFHREGVSPVITIHSEPFAIAGRNGAQWRMTVRDNGIGFEQKFADRIFAPFQRLHGRAKYEGTGIGLAVVKKIVDRQGWDIEVVSEVGVGTTFTISSAVAHGRMFDSNRMLQHSRIAA